MKSYAELKRRFHRLSALSDAASMLHWDASVHMPTAAAPARAEQLAELKLVRHEILTAADLADLIWSVREHVAILSQSMALAPGDIIMTGTPAGVAALVEGDVVTGGVDGIATLEVTIGPRA